MYESREESATVEAYRKWNVGLVAEIAQLEQPQEARVFNKTARSRSASRRRVGAARGLEELLRVQREAEEADRRVAFIQSYLRWHQPFALMQHRAATRIQQFCADRAKGAKRRWQCAALARLRGRVLLASLAQPRFNALARFLAQGKAQRALCSVAKDALVAKLERRLLAADLARKNGNIVRRAAVGVWILEARKRALVSDLLHDTQQRARRVAFIQWLRRAAEKRRVAKAGLFWVTRVSVWRRRHTWSELLRLYAGSLHAQEAAVVTASHFHTAFHREARAQGRRAADLAALRRVFFAQWAQAAADRSVFRTVVSEMILVPLDSMAADYEQRESAVYNA